MKLDAKFYGELRKEDPDERRMFDQNVETLGSPLAVIANGLRIASVTAPPHGSYGKMMAIWANEVTRALGQAGEGESNGR